MEHLCIDCDEPVPPKRVRALLALYPPVNGNPNLPDVPLRCIPCAEKHVKPYVASGGDEDGNGWVPDHTREELVF